jgi:hypothetical protein
MNPHQRAATVASQARPRRMVHPGRLQADQAPHAYGPAFRDPLLTKAGVLGHRVLDPGMDGVPGLDA